MKSNICKIVIFAMMMAIVFSSCMNQFEKEYNVSSVEKEDSVLKMGLEDRQARVTIQISDI